MRAGKDSFYEIVKEAGYDVERIAFADSLKIISQETMVAACETLKIPQEDFMNKDLMRGFWIKFGTGIMRKRLPDIWRDITFSIHKQRIESGNWIITDCRFMNELRDDATIVLIECDKQVLWERYKRDFPRIEYKQWLEYYNSQPEQLPEIIKEKHKKIVAIENNLCYNSFRRKVLDLVKEL